MEPPRTCQQLSDLGGRWESNGQGGNGGLGGTVALNSSSGTNLPGSYIVSDTVISGAETISGTVDLYLQASTLNNFTFPIGDIGSGISGNTAGDSITLYLTDTLGTDNLPQFRVVDSNNNILTSGSIKGTGATLWRKMDFLWTPTNANGKEGSLSFAMREITSGDKNFTTSINYTFNDPNLKIGFGTTGNNPTSTSQFDNINVVSAVPEPSILTLLSFLAMGFLLRRNRQG